MRKVIAFCGYQSSGKSYSAKRLMMTMGFIKTSFAEMLRYVTADIAQISYEDLIKNYDKFKKEDIFPNYTGRKLMENIGASVRKYDPDFWAKGVLKFIKETPKNVCIDDLRYSNEYRILKNYCDKNNIEFKLVFCDYHSEDYEDSNQHESTQLARYLKNLGYTDQDYVDELDILNYELLRKKEDNN